MTGTVHMRARGSSDQELGASSFGSNGANRGQDVRTIVGDDFYTVVLPDADAARVE